MINRLSLLLFILLTNFAYAQYPPTYWPSNDKVNLDFRFEPPRMDTFDFLPKYQQVYSYIQSVSNVITNKSGEQLGYFCDSTYLDFYQYGFYDMNHQLIQKIYYEQKFYPNIEFLGPGFLSFDDSTHYFIKPNDNYLHIGLNFFKLNFTNAHLDSISFIYSNIKVPGGKNYTIQGADTLIISNLRLKGIILKKNNRVFVLFDYIKPINSQFFWGLVLIELDKNLNIIENAFSKIYYSESYGLSVLAINKLSSKIYAIRGYTYYDSIKNISTYADSLFVFEIDTNFNLSNTKNLLNNISGGYIAAVLSANDSFLYLLKTAFFQNNVYSDSLLQVNVFTGEKTGILISKIFKVGQSTSRNKLAIAPNGKIYIRAHSGDSIYPYRYHVIEQPNRKYPDCKISYNIYKSDYDSIGLRNGWRYSKYEDVRNGTPINPFYVYTDYFPSTCAGDSFVNRSDAPFKNFVWYWGDGDTTVTTDTQKFVKHKYSIQGTYFLRVKGSLSTGYWAWYSDSITVGCYLNPGYYVKDSVGCQWIAQTFYDTTCANVRTIKREWDFGDGESAITYLPMITHVYKKSGVYDVSMKVSSGTCSETVSKTTVINILPAPKPGFVLDKLMDCVPPSAQFTVSDTLTQLVSKKTYRFDDGLTDSIIPVNQHSINYVYHTKSKYKILQTLYSPSGCISKDSLYINVYNNLSTAIPTQPIVSINENNIAEIFWARNNDVSLYHLFRAENYQSTGFLKSVSDTFTTDNSAKNVFSSSYQYTLQYQDQCQNKSTQGKYETSILLTGKNHKNAYSTLNWNRNNNDGTPLVYDLFKTRDADTSWIKTITQNSFTDYGFYSDSSIKTGYKIYTNYHSGARISSNSAKIGYEPFVIIPTLYDVNHFTSGLPIRSFFLKDFTIEIFDILGRRVFTDSNISSWHGEGHYTGHFFYRIRGTSKEDQFFQQNGRILLVR
ncbi:MAG: PKD domain-containing protein [Bacteroidota bacterium]|nr:PKD domain-containing protein [Bacteroidota bacterium]